MKNLEGEIIVVDNASVDGTVQSVQKHFPEVVLIANPDNRGFAKANNQAIAIAKGEFVLLLNPDTIVSEDTLDKCVQFMSTHQDAGALGVRMLDGSGQYLPESKRGLPTLSASFMKMTGLYKLFPRSAGWNAYYQGHIGEHETAVIQVLSGAFMFMRRSVLEKTGFLDEEFFMYGEDIDLSYRITKAGFRVYYFPETEIIHYKGESTRKSSLNYILTFYQAMLIFTNKHPEFSGQKILIHLAIYFHGLLQLIRQNISRWWPLTLDTFIIAGAFITTSKVWAIYKYHDQDYFKTAFYTFNVPLYTLLIILSMYLNGAYDKPFQKRNSWMGFITGLIMILGFYALLPVHLRSSRMVILAGSGIILLWLWLSRTRLSPWRMESKDNEHGGTRKAIIIAEKEESGRIKELINRSKDQIEILGTIPPQMSHPSVSSDDVLGTMAQLEDLVRIYHVKEIIFSAQDVPFSQFTESMTRLGPSLRYMLAATSTMNIVGSAGKDTEGESYAIRIHFNLSEISSRRVKRIFDLIASLVLFAFFPLLLIFVPHSFVFLSNISKVFIGNMTWVAYHPLDPVISSLPKLKPGVLHPSYPKDQSELTRRLQHIHYVYARDYHWTTDLSILVAQLKKAGQNNSGYEQ
jgi:GT2 family glycosyltransferase